MPQVTKIFSIFVHKLTVCVTSVLLASFGKFAYRLSKVVFIEEMCLYFIGAWMIHSKVILIVTMLQLVVQPYLVFNTFLFRPSF